MKKSSIFIFLFMIAVFTYCKKENAPDCFSATGADVSEVRDLGSFYAIELNANMELNLKSGSDYKVEVVAGEYIKDKISASVKSGTLILDNNNTCNFVRGYKRVIRINVTVPFITKVTHNAVGNIYFDEGYHQDSTLNIRAESSGDTYIRGNFGNIFTSSHGNGDMYLSGTAKQLNVYSNGTNYTWAEALKVSGYIFISTASIGDTYLHLNSTNELDYYIEKDGNIYYTGTPAKQQELSDGTAKGKLIKLD